MKSFITFFLSISITMSPFSVAQAQEKLSPEDQAKLDQAQNLAVHFVERFRRTWDFRTVWNEFHGSDIICSIRTTPVLRQFNGSELKEKPFDQRLKEMRLNDRLLERLYIAYWNSALMSQAYFYSLTSSKDGSEPDVEALMAGKQKAPGSKQVAAVFRKFADADARRGKHDPRTAKDFNKMIVDSNRLAALFRKYMPKDALKSANWKSAVMWFADVHNFRQVRGRDPNSDFCDERKGPIYVAQIGHFCLGFVEENGKMKLLTMILITQ